jgi:MFS family permease
MGLQSMFTYSWMVWTPAFMIRVHGLTTAYVGPWLGLSMGVGAAVGNVVGGHAADRLVRRYGISGYPLFCLVALLGTIPFALIFISTPSSTLAFTAFTLFMILLAGATPPCFAIWLSLVPSRMRAIATALLGAVTGLAGLGLGPVLIGVLNDRLAPVFHDLAIRFSFLASLALPLGAALFYWQASRTAASDYQPSTPRAV